MKKIIIGLSITVIIGLFLVINIYGQTSKRRSSPSDKTPLTKGSFIQIAQKNSPAVVNVYPMGEAGVFGTQRKLGDGSGFIIDSKKGILLTNNHVVREAKKGLKIGLNDKRKFNATVIGTDPIYDVAVVQIENPPPNLKQVTIGNSDKVAVGEWVMAIGQPLGMEYTATVGIVSALGRELEHIRGKPRTTMEYMELYIQIDALINPGNSGGPLFNLNGEVIGMNTAGGRGYGFAIPIKAALEIKDMIMKDGKVIRAYLGLIGKDFTDDRLISLYNITIEDLVKKLKLKEAKGIFVQGCADDSPAQAAGFLEGDVIIEMAGQKINDLKGIRALMEKQKPGTKVKIKYIREGKEETVSVELGEMESGEASKEETTEDEDDW